MVIVSDTSAITNLLQIGLLNILPQLYGEVLIPQSVYDELSAIPTQEAALSDQQWLIIHADVDTDYVNYLLGDLDLGEAQAIALAVELSADYIIIDERVGRTIAKRENLDVIGLLGLLIRAKQEGYIQGVKHPLDRLMSEAGFYVAPSLYSFVLQQADEA